MLSILVYGRNDSHGYNYPKRLALSLNGFAEILDQPGDEILFADANSPDDLPTAPEAIQDTLTEKAKSLLKIIRIRPKHAPALIEPVARNAALRRSNPANRWILSTNTDMLFVPVTKDESLSRIAASLPDGFYQLPRFEIPEWVWETCLHRSEPDKTLSFLRANGKAMQLHAIARRPGFLLFDSPGDFQCALRSDLFQIGGFDEAMTLGWHVDANLCKRLSLLGRTAASVEKRLLGFHCNHTKKETFLHSQRKTENDWTAFVKNVSSPFHGNEDWGLKDLALEEISLQKPRSFAFRFPEKIYDFTIDSRLYNSLSYSTNRIWPYLYDHLVHLAPKTRVAYFGNNQKLLELLKRLDLEIAPWNPDAELFLFDFGFDEEIPYKEGRKKLKEILRAFLKTVRKNRGKTFIGVNAPRSDFALLFEWHLAVKKNTYITGLMYGKPQKKRFRPKLFLQYWAMRLFYFHTDAIVRFFSGRLFKS